MLLADKGSRRIRGNYLAGSLFPRFNGPSHCNCSCGCQAAPSHPKARPWAAEWRPERRPCCLPTCPPNAGGVGSVHWPQVSSMWCGSLAGFIMEKAGSPLCARDLLTGAMRASLPSLDLSGSRNLCPCCGASLWPVGAASVSRKAGHSGR